MTELPDHLAVGVKIVQRQRKNHLRTDFYNSVLYLKTSLFKPWKSVNMRRKQQSYTHVVKSTWNQALSLPLYYQARSPLGSLSPLFPFVVGINDKWRQRRESLRTRKPYYSQAVSPLKSLFTKVSRHSSRLLNFPAEKLTARACRQ